MSMRPFKPINQVAAMAAVLLLAISVAPAITADPGQLEPDVNTIASYRFTADGVTAQSFDIFAEDCGQPTPLQITAIQSGNPDGSAEFLAMTYSVDPITGLVSADETFAQWGLASQSWSSVVTPPTGIAVLDVFAALRDDNGQLIDAVQTRTITYSCTVLTSFFEQFMPHYSVPVEGPAAEAASSQAVGRESARASCPLAVRSIVNTIREFVTTDIDPCDTVPSVPSCDELLPRASVDPCTVPPLPPTTCEGILAYIRNGVSANADASPCTPPSASCEGVAEYVREFITAQPGTFDGICPLPTASCPGAVSYVDRFVTLPLPDGMCNVPTSCEEAKDYMGRLVTGAFPNVPCNPTCEDIGYAIGVPLDSRKTACGITELLPPTDYEVSCDSSVSELTTPRGGSGIPTANTGSCVSILNEMSNCLAGSATYLATTTASGAASMVLGYVGAITAQIGQVAGSAATDNRASTAAAMPAPPACNAASQPVPCDSSAAAPCSGEEIPCEACDVDREGLYSDLVPTDPVTPALRESLAAAGRVGLQFMPPTMSASVEQIDTPYTKFVGVGAVSIDFADAGKFSQGSAVIPGDLVVIDDESKKGENMGDFWKEDCVIWGAIGIGAGVATEAGLVAAGVIAGGGPAVWTAVGVGVIAGALVCAAQFGWKWHQGDFAGYITCGFIASGVRFGPQDAVSSLFSAGVGDVVNMGMTSNSPTLAEYYYDDQGNVVDGVRPYVPVHSRHVPYDEGRAECEAASDASLHYANERSNFYGTVIGVGITSLNLDIELVPVSVEDLIPVGEDAFFSPVEGLVFGCDSTPCPISLGLKISQCGEVQLIADSMAAATYSFVGNPLKDCTEVSYRIDGVTSGSVSLASPVSLTLEYEATAG